MYCWIQGDLDLDYYNKFKNTDGIQLIPPNKDAYEHILNTEDLDYIGTRLHGGIYAMRHKKELLLLRLMNVLKRFIKEIT